MAEWKKLKDSLEAVRQLLPDLCQQLLGSLRFLKQETLADFAALEQRMQEVLSGKDKQIEHLSQELLRIKNNYLNIEKQVDALLSQEHLENKKLHLRIKQLQQKLASTHKIDLPLSRPEGLLQVIEELQDEELSSKRFDSQFSQIQSQAESPMDELSVQKHWNSIISKQNAMVRKKGKFIEVPSRALQPKKKQSLNKSILQELDKNNASVEYLPTEPVQIRPRGLSNPKQQPKKTITIKIMKKPAEVHPRPQQVLGVSSFNLQRLQNKYIGQRLNSMKHGNGSLYYNKGISYIGQFNHNMREGFGILKKDGIQVYHGQWYKDQFNGEGRLKNLKNIEKKSFSSDSSISDWINYSGGFRNNKFDGIGSMVLGNGDRFVGQFCNGQAEGEGCLQRRSGEVVRGWWQGNRLRE